MDNSVINSQEDDRQKVKLIIVPAAEKTIQRHFADPRGIVKDKLVGVALDPSPQLGEENDMTASKASPVSSSQSPRSPSESQR